GLFPGRRRREDRQLFPIMIDAAHVISNQLPEISFEVAAASESLALEIQQALAKSSLRERARIVTGDAPGTMQRGFAGIIASGTATLEAAYFRLPFVLVYKVSWPTSLAGRLVLLAK